MTLTAELRARLAAHAKRRELKVATLARVFLHEHVTELDDAVELSKSEEWQRAQAWATWEKIKAGDVREVSLEQLEQDTRRALEQVKARSRSR